MPRFVARSAAFLFAGISAIVVAVGCSGDSPRSATASSTSSVKTTNDSNDGSVDLGGARYEAIALSETGTLTGRVSFGANAAAPDTSSASHDTVPAATADTAVVKCSAPRSRRSKKAAKAAAVREGPSVAVVWIAGITKGKALPEEKRGDLDSENCMLDPHLLAVPVGTTINVGNDERALHTLIFTRNAGRDTLTRMPFFNVGQVVASERLAKIPGIVDVTCVQHPWTHSSIAVFAHPYYAVTDPAGKFTIDSLPPGSYAVMVWSPGMTQPKQLHVTVTAGGTANLDVDVSGKRGQ